MAIGFEGVEEMALVDGLGLQRNRRGALPCGSDWQTTAPGVFVCGDAHRGASLVVWAIAEGAPPRTRLMSFDGRVRPAGTGASVSVAAGSRLMAGRCA